MTTWQKVLTVAVGSGIGGALRAMLVWFTSARITSTFPLGVLLVNVIGCFAFGVAVRYGTGSGGMSDSTRLALTTGLCGGFTTFSAFGMDIIEGLESGRPTMVTTYVVTSIVLGVGAMLAGLALGRAMTR